MIHLLIIWVSLSSDSIPIHATTYIHMGTDTEV